MGRVTRIVVPALAVCWLAVGLSAWRGRRRDVGRDGPVRWHRAVATLQGWSPDHDGVPAATTWCRPVTMPVPLADVPRQRSNRSDESAAALVPTSRSGS
jgi:hypothetical protein